MKNDMIGGNTILRIIQNASAPQKISRVLDLGEYDPIFKGAEFHVWVNPTRNHLDEWRILTESMIAAQKDSHLNTDKMKQVLREHNERVVRWYAATWLNIDESEAIAIRDALLEFDNTAWDWLKYRTSQIIGEYRRERLGN